MLMWIVFILCFLINPAFGFLVLLSWGLVTLVKKLRNSGVSKLEEAVERPQSSENTELFFGAAKKLKERTYANNAERENQKKLDRVAAGYLLSSRRFGRVTFKNIVLDSPTGNTAHTEIDEIIVSPFGIFCIEYKAHKGYIFGSEKKGTWTQCTYKGKYPIHNPIHQNYKHIKALEDLLGSNVKAPIHSYVVFTDATKIEVDSNNVFNSYESMAYRINLHNKQVYTLEEYEDILIKLAYASTKSTELLPIHINEVKAYLASVAV